MAFTVKDIREYAVSIVIALLVVGGGWVYLDQKRDAILKQEMEVTGKRIEVDRAQQTLAAQQTELKKREAELTAREKLVTKREEKLNKDSRVAAERKALDALVKEYLDKYGGVDLKKNCADGDEAYMQKYRNAQALLDLIEAQARELERHELIENFVKKRKAPTAAGPASTTCGQAKEPARARQ